MARDVETWIDSLAWSPDGRLLAVASGDYWGEYDDNLLVWVVNVETGQITFTTTHESLAQFVWSPSGDTLWIGSGNGLIQRYEVATGMLQAETAERSWSEFYRLESISLSPDGTRLAAISTRLYNEPQQFTIYDALTLQPVVSIDPEFTQQNDVTNALTWVDYGPDGSLLATTGWDGLVRLWSANTLSPLGTISVSPGRRLYGGDWNSDGRLTVGGESPEAAILDIQAGQVIARIFTRGGTPTWHPDGRQITTGSQYWDTVTGQPTGAVSFGISEVQGIEVNPSAMDISSTGIVAQGIAAEGKLQIGPNDNPLTFLAPMMSVPPALP